jgi:hypothetical protein
MDVRIQLRLFNLVKLESICDDAIAKVLVTSCELFDLCELF